MLARRLSGWAVFDLDGTLVDTLGDIASALNRVLQKHDRESLPKEEVKDLVGKGPRILVERAWIRTGREAEAGRLGNFTREYLAEYLANPKGKSRPFPGVEDGLQRLILRGWKLGVCTNKDGVAARALIRELGWDRWIRVVVSGGEKVRKPDARPLRWALDQLRAGRGGHRYVGDSGIDMETARNAG
ncbi:MAG: HAD hydrolase-like protein, partial [Verrucomicrobia bacterium]|nr:HAD hydrolase-like protein [Verrucomicrobiota bacterium]